MDGPLTHSVRSCTICAMTTTGYPDVGDVARRLGIWRAKAKIPLVDLAYMMRDVLPEPMWVSFETLRRMEVGALNKTDPVLIAAWAKICKGRASDLGDGLVSDLAKLREFTAASSRKPRSRTVDSPKPDIRRYPEAA